MMSIVTEPIDVQEVLRSVESNDAGAIVYLSHRLIKERVYYILNMKHFSYGIEGNGNY